MKYYEHVAEPQSRNNNKREFALVYFCHDVHNVFQNVMFWCFASPKAIQSTPSFKSTPVEYSVS